ncbi:CBS domain-containing protein [uncultured Sulfitobacter sp.]|uniref:CBS domain-containing protein n=1 Tax=uncultured Sulfitobacter sp. TaxID=191468 RepID=UPI002619116D|nr:CBS domain-containing protein [uncultured Sulfitobacter sp.]
MTDRPRVRDYMATDLVTLDPGMEINRAMHVLLDKRLSGAPVVDKTGWLIGILSKKDCLKAALQTSYWRDWGKTVADHMTREVETLPAEMDIVTAAEAFLASKYRRFPVMQEGKLAGQVSRADILRALSDQWSQTNG